MQSDVLPSYAFRVALEMLVKTTINGPIIAVLESAALRSSPPHVPGPFMIWSRSAPASTSYTSGKASTAPRPVIESPRISANPRCVLSKNSPYVIQPPAAVQRNSVA
jgi:hypothetical protein